MLNGKPTDQKNVRLSNRLKVFIPIELHFNSGFIRVHMLDVSETGARLVLPKNDGLITSGRIDLPNLLVSFQVTRQNGRYIGIRFKRLLTSYEIEFLLHSS
jgi:hypothetical protein